MEKDREMNKAIFYENLMMTIHEIMDMKNVDESKIRFKIVPVYEKEKSFSSMDDSIRSYMD